MNRISRDKALIQIATVVGARSTCERKRVGAVISMDGRIISTGYAGAPSGMPHCTDTGCITGPDGGCLNTVHAEANAIVFAARHGIATSGSDLHCTLSPCLKCAQLIINAGIKTVTYLEEYRVPEGVALLIKAGIKVRHATFHS